MKKRNLVIAALLMLAFVVTGFTYAYWAESIVAPTNGEGTATVVIGEGKDVNTTLTVAIDTAGADRLVPVGHGGTVGSVTYVESITRSFTVTWAGEGNGAKGAIGTLVVEKEGLLLEGDATHIALFTVTISFPDGAEIIADGAAVTVNVTFVFASEPATKAIYDAVVGKTLSQELVFSVTPAA